MSSARRWFRRGRWVISTLWPTDPIPTVATLNAVDGTITSNSAIVPSNNGSINAFVTNPTHLILDINGYFAP